MNPASKHYYDDGGKPTIQQFEEKYPPTELYIWAKITREKYLSRVGKKEGTDDKAKIEDYTRYIVFLEQTVLPVIVSEVVAAEDPISLSQLPASDWYKKLSIEMEYEV